MFQCKVPLDPGFSWLSRFPVCSSPGFQAFYPAETSFYAAEVSSRSLWSSLCHRRLHRNRIPRILNRISTCNSNTSTKVSGLGILYLFLYLQCFCIKFRNCKKFYSTFGTNSSKHSKFVIILTRYIQNDYRIVRNRS